MEQQQELKHHFGANLGRIYEILFNTGFLAAITQHRNVTHHYEHLYRDDLKHLQKQKLLSELYKRSEVTNQMDKEQIHQWALYFMHKGYFAGLNLFTEYLHSFRHERKTSPREIVYLQCNFYGQNSFYIYDKNEKAAVQGLMQQFHQFQPNGFTIMEEEIREHNQKGRFLKADTLLLLRCGRTWRILSIDLSVFSLRHIADAKDLTTIETVRSILTSEVAYNRSRSVFSNMNIDTEHETFVDTLLSEPLKTYFTAFKRNDKETAKVIQAASYAYDFYQFLLKKNILSVSDRVLFNIVGYTDRAINAFSVKQDQLAVLQTCADIYRTSPTNTEIGEARDAVLKRVQRAARKGFGGDRAFLEKVVHLADNHDGPQWLTQTETLSDFLNTWTPMTQDHLSPSLRAHLDPSHYLGKSILDVHAHLVHTALRGSHPYLFLTGMPGAGKTTALVNFLKQARSRNEGFLLLYISPRKEVNLDIIQKFRETTTSEPPCSQIFGITTNSLIIRNAHDTKAVHYYSDERHDTFRKKNVTFIHADGDDAKLQRSKGRTLDEIQEGLLVDKGERIAGVLNTLCTALNISLSEPKVQALVATVAVQSLKRLDNPKKSTLHHLETIFKGVTNDRGEVIPQKMQELSKHVKHLFVMIDEVTGDESGVEFLHGLHQFLEDHNLLNSSLINTKVIVADASIVSSKIIRQHLEVTTYEPNKVYFCQADPHADQSYPLHRENFSFLRTPATVINANAYPASQLNITYKIGVDPLQFDPATFQERSKQLEEEKKTNMIADIIQTLDDPLVKQQLVYIQDKQRLADLIQRIRRARGGQFEHKIEYLEINANISEKDRDDIKQHKNTARVIFMTASASRGLSFPQATRILIDIPHFEIEQNLMEILQVIYRGRGDKQYDTREKDLLFYLTDQIVYTEQEDRPYSVRESMVHLLNILLILKTSMMTRIKGSLKLGVNQHFTMIPIGGKSVSSAGETFTSRISALMREAQTLSYRYHDDNNLLVVRDSLKKTLENVHIYLRPQGQRIREGEQVERQNYIALIPTFAKTFEKKAEQGFDQLLHLPPMELAHVNGGLLTVPLLNISVQEAYRIQFEEVLKDNQAHGVDLLAVMNELRVNSRYPASFQNLLEDGIALIQALQKMNEHKIPHYEQESSYTDQHYALPIAVFLLHEEMERYFAEHPEPDTTDNPLHLPFHSLLSRYIHLLYPSDSILPIATSYKAFPFLVFRSLNVSEARSKMFTGKYLFMSREMNIINMLLSSTKDE